MAGPFTCRSPGREYDSRKGGEPCVTGRLRECTEDLCCKALRCFNSGNNGNAHVCKGAGLGYDATKDESLCPKSGCSDELCCRKEVTMAHAPTDAGHAAAVGAACAALPAVAALAMLAL